MNGFKTKKYTKKCKITGVLTAIKMLKLGRDIDHSKEKNHQFQRLQSNNSRRQHKKRYVMNSRHSQPLRVRTITAHFRQLAFEQR
uniref:SFRICE_032753 n=1 Tax=Spodoptera frugiperda TaxID=7108 RepID=A0A2H1WWM1_SPOFR